MKNICINIRFLALLMLVSVFSSYQIQAQSHKDPSRRRPTVGVVLCGGGAKGFAHIPILKAIDNAGIPVDYIAGTSIGSIIGSLYAAGYDPDMMEKIVREQDWNQVIYDKIPRTLIPVEQKMQERQYLATFPIKNGKIKVKPALVDGLYVNLLLSKLMLPVSEIHDYRKLPVPFFCIATDVEHACQYEMTEGNLARSVRSSMSIPFLFKPVSMDGRVFVDGGMVNNFPVRNMEERGVDIIIGVDLEDSIIPASKIDNSIELFESMLNLSSLEESNYARSHCDLYIKPNLHGRNMMSFDDFDSIIKFGEDAANEYYPYLKKLAGFLHDFENYEIERPHTQLVDSLTVAKIEVVGIGEKHKSGVVREFGKRFPKKMSMDDIHEVIIKLKASGYYEDLWYETEETHDGMTLKLHCKEIADKTTSFCIHYDNEYGIGALVNFNMKNIWHTLNRATLNLDINIAENPYIRCNLNKRYGRIFSYGADLSVISVRINQLYDANITNTYSIQSNTLDIYAQLVPSLTQQIRIGGVLDYVHMKDLVGEGGLKIDYSLYSYLYLKYYYGNEDSPNFAMRGWKVNFLGKCVFYEGLSYIVHADVLKSFPIGKKHSVKLGVEGGTKIGEPEVPLFYQFLVGGQSKMNYYDNIVAFSGLNFVDKVVDHFTIGKLAWQWNFYKIFYSTLSFDCGFMSDVYDFWFDHNSFVCGAGLAFGADTVIGPVEVSLMGSNINSHPVGFINVGFWF